MLLRQYLQFFGELGDAFVQEFKHPFLVEEEGSMQGKSLETRGAFMLEPEVDGILLGRSPRARLIVPRPNVSGQHLRLFSPPQRGRPWQVMDLGSTNGTYINERRLAPKAPKELRDGDVLRMGPDDSFEFLSPRSLLFLLSALRDEGHMPAVEEPTQPRPAAPRKDGPAKVHGDAMAKAAERRSPESSARGSARVPRAPETKGSERAPRAPDAKGSARAPKPGEAKGSERVPRAPDVKGSGRVPKAADAKGADRVKRAAKPEADPASRQAGERPSREGPPARVRKAPRPRSQLGPSAVLDLLTAARSQAASDLHLQPGMAPMVRVDGELSLLEGEQPLTAADLEGMVQLITDTEELERFDSTGDLDYCYDVDGLRYRTNVCRHQDGAAITFRVIRPQIPTLDELRIPPQAADLTDFAQGLVLITGPLGSGKTSSMLALVNEVNRARADHIITIEDPIEFILPPIQCQVSQRQLGTHTRSFGSALRGALREDPDIIVIGDLRDYETASLAISAAETGHLVFASMATVNAMKAIDKLLDLFPAGEQAATRTMLSESLRGILCQHLLPAKKGGRVPAVELLFNSIAVANIIREGNTAGLKNAMQTGRAQGMRSMEASLEELVQAGVISPQTAAAGRG
jgi:twitching motility protein PilT